MRRSVLVVEADPESRDLMSTWLDEAGFDVSVCPGPSAPDYTCVGGREGVCPLVEPADVIVMDLWLSSRTVEEGTLPQELLAYYVNESKPIIALSRSIDGLRPFLEEWVVPLRWPTDRRALVETVRRAVSMAAAPRS